MRAGPELLFSTMSTNTFSNGTSPNQEACHSIFDDSKVENGTKFFLISDMDAVVCLITLGFKVRKDPPTKVVKNPDGNVITTVYFNTVSDCGKYTVEKFMKAYKHDAKYVNENPDCPMAFVIAAVKNKSSIIRSLSSITPSVCMRPTEHSGPVIRVVEGSEKHKNCLLKGMVHVNPDCIIKFN